MKYINERYYDLIKTKTIFSPYNFILRCNGCGYGFYEKKIDYELLNKYYKSIYWQSVGLQKKDWNNSELFLKDQRAIGQYLFVNPFLSSFDEFNVLELGAGSALFSRYLRYKKANKIKLNVVEPGKGWAEYYKKNDINLIADYFPFQTKDKFSYIHTSHWLEHIIDLNDIIKNIKNILAPNGLIFVEVPNCNSEYFSLDKGDTPHIHFFTKKSLQILFEKTGFNTLSINEFGLTTREELKRRRNHSIDNEILNEGQKSIKNNIPRKGGNCIRAIFQLQN